MKQVKSEIKKQVKAGLQVRAAIVGAYLVVKRNAEVARLISPMMHGELVDQLNNVDEWLCSCGKERTCCAPHTTECPLFGLRFNGDAK